jgi:pseudaminic acid synthase
MIKLGSKEIGCNCRPYIIAEMSGNHNQSLEKAISIVEAAAASGADALKIQTYTPDTMTLNLSEGEFFIQDKKSLWEGRSLYDLYSDAMTPWDWHRPIMNRCRELGLEFFSTPFDDTAVDFLEELDVPFYKIASFENTDIPLIRRVAKTGKPVIVSTGLATLKEIGETVETIRAEGNEQIILLKCTSAYPARPEDANLITIKNLRETFGVEVGLSDHTMGTTVPIVAICQGASVIEKHFTISRSDKGVDSAFSMEPEEFKQMIIELNKARASMGRVFYGISEAEKNSLLFKRSLYICEDLKEGEALNEENLRAIRPGFGLPPKYLDVFLGKRVSKDVKRGTALNWDLV